MDSTFYVIGCEQFPVTLQCPSGKNATILNAFYGRLDSKICCGSDVPTNKCNVPCYKDVTSIAKQLCGTAGGSCSFPSNNGVFEDPCVDTYKYTMVNYACN